MFRRIMALGALIVPLSLAMASPAEPVAVPG